jgi:hypothetical protein
MPACIGMTDDECGLMDLCHGWQSVPRSFRRSILPSNFSRDKTIFDHQVGPAQHVDLMK